MDKDKKRVIGLSKLIIEKYHTTKEDVEKSLPVHVQLTDSQFIEILLGFYLKKNEGVDMNS